LDLHPTSLALPSGFLNQLLVLFSVLLENFVELLGLGTLPSAWRRATISCILLGSNTGSSKCFLAAWP
jgi:hypothetical protein